MSIKYGLFLPVGFVQELAEIPNPVEAYETLTRWAQTAEQSGYDYEAVGVQGPVIHFLDATRLDDVRLFAKTFIA
jgi:hypothetical protein